MIKIFLILLFSGADMIKSQKPLLLNLRGRQFLNPYHGLQDIYASAKICNRCGACAQACPSYKALGAEIYSPRGRNQLLRFILDRRITNKAAKKDILRPAETCLMCGQCAASCAAFAPAAKHMRQIKRAYHRGDDIRLMLPKFSYFLKTIGLRQPKAERIDAFYMPASDGIKHFRQSLALISKKYRGVKIIKSGLFLAEISLTQSLSLLKKTFDNILAEYQAVLSAEPLPIVVDNIEDYRLLKQSIEIDEKYQTLADNARFITDYIGEIKIKNKKIILQDNNIFFQDDKIQQKAKEIIVCGKGNIFVHLEQGLHSAGLLPYCRVKGARIIAGNLIAAVAAQKADILVVFSARDEKFFTKLLKPYIKVLHICNITTI